MQPTDASLATDSLRVLAVGTLFPNPAQPSRGVFNALAMRQLAQVAGVRVVAPVRWFPGLSFAANLERRAARIPPGSAYHGIPVTHPRFFSAPRLGLRWHGWFYDLSVQRHLHEAADAFRPDVLLAFEAHPDGCAALRFGAKRGLPVVIKCMGSDTCPFFFDPDRSPQALDALRNCAHVIAGSEGLRQLILKHGIPPGQVETVRNGVDRKIFRPMPRTDARRALRLPVSGKVVLCAASLLPVKRHHDLLQAFRILRCAHQIEARLVLVGEGPLEGSLRRHAAALRIACDVQFVGNCRLEAVPLWLNAADAVCLASSNEDLPDVLGEALACGRPVVATRVGSIPELVTGPEYGRLVPPGDPESMADALCGVLGCAWDPLRLAACPQVVSWQECAARIFQILNRVRESRPLQLQV